MTYQRDANEIATEYAHRQEDRGVAEVNRAYGPPQGTLTIWDTIELVDAEEIYQGNDVSIDVSKPGILIAYSGNGDAEIFVLQPGWYINFVPNREGE